MGEVYAPELWTKRRPRMYTPERAAFLLANRTLDVLLLAAELKVSPRFVCSYQRKLGIRKFTTGNPNSRVRPMEKKPTVIIAGALHEIELVRADSRRLDRDIGELMRERQNQETKKGPALSDRPR